MGDILIIGVASGLAMIMFLAMVVMSEDNIEKSFATICGCIIAFIMIFGIWTLIKPTNNEETKKQLEHKFITIYEGELEKEEYYDIVYDSETKVMYSISKGSRNEGNATLLVDENGKPKIYENQYKKGDEIVCQEK